MHTNYANYYAYKLFHKLCKLFINKSIGRHLKETVLWSTITWSEKGKHNVQGIRPIERDQANLH